MDEYICKIASLEEIHLQWDTLIAEHVNRNQSNWIYWKETTIRDQAEGKIIPYYSILSGRIICEATARICADGKENMEGLVDEETAYLFAFRTVTEWQGQGYWLYRFMEEDLKKRGYRYLTLGVEPTEEKNNQIYRHYGFVKFIKNEIDTYPNGTKVEVNYYQKTL